MPAQVTIKAQVGGSKPWRQRHTPQADKIRWHGGSHLDGGVSRLGEYLIAADRGITFRRPGAAPG